MTLFIGLKFYLKLFDLIYCQVVNLRLHFRSHNAYSKIFSSSLTEIAKDKIGIVAEGEK